MKLENVDFATQPGDDVGVVSEGFVNGTLACLVTGSPALHEGKDIRTIASASWFVEQLCTGIRRNALKWESLTKVLESAVQSVQQVAHEANADWESALPQAQATAYVAMIRAGHKQLDYLVLGPCTLVVLPDSRERQVITDERLNPFHHRIVDFIHEMQTVKGMTYGDAFKKALPLLSRTREVMNTPDGYYSVSIDGAGIYHAVTGSIPYASAKILLATDGFRRTVDLFQNASWEELLDPNRFLSTEISMLRDAELRDSECLEVPRLHVRDNAAAIKFSVTRGGKVHR